MIVSTGFQNLFSNSFSNVAYTFLIILLQYNIHVHFGEPMCMHFQAFPK